MTWNKRKKLIITCCALIGLVLTTTAAPAAVLPDDEEAGATQGGEKTLVNVEETCTGGETRVKIKVIGDGKIIESGTPEKIAASEIARRIYLGDEFKL